MIQIDMGTVLMSFVMGNTICAAVMTSLWLVNRGRYAGLGFWLADFIVQFLAVVLAALRGIVPVPIAIAFGTPMVVVGAVLLYQGLERYTGKTSSQWHNYFLLAGLTTVQAYFTRVRPSPFARSIGFELAMLAIFSQCAWLMLRRVDPGMRRNTRLVGAIFGVYCLISLLRIYIYIWPFRRARTFSPPVSRKCWGLCANSRYLWRSHSAWS